MGESLHSASRSILNHADDFPSECCNRLTVVHAAPLGFVHKEEFHPLELLDFETEREALIESMKAAGESLDCKVDLDFKIGTAHQLATLLARGQSTILHVSCHGNSSYLALENGWGVVHPLWVEDLRALLSVVGAERLPRLVFVLASNSRTVGEALVDAGVSHVICCQRDDPQLLHTWAVEFARHFYHALVCGMTLTEAFEYGHIAVNVSPEGQRRMTRLVMLPEDESHNVSIFSITATGQKRVALRPSQPRQLKQMKLLHPPGGFLHRQQKMYRVMEALKDKRIRLVRVSGPAGIGKSNLVSAICNYIRERFHLHFQDAPLWLPDDCKDTSDTLARCCSHLFRVFNGCQSACDVAYKQSCNTIFSHFYPKKSLVIIDATSVDDLTELRSFVERLCNETLFLKVIVFHHDNDTSWGGVSSVQTYVEVTQFDLEPISKPHSLCDRQSERVCPPNLSVALKDEDAPITSPSLSGTCSNSIVQFGIGKAAAEDLTPSDLAISYTHTISRAALDKRLTELEETVMRARQEHDFVQALQLEEFVDVMASFCESLPDIETLTDSVECVLSDRERAIQLGQFDEAAVLENNLKSLCAQIDVETSTSEVGDTTLSLQTIRTYENSSKRPDVSPTTRAGLQTEIERLESMIIEASERNDFHSADRIEQKRQRLINRKTSLPTVCTLQSKIRSLDDTLEQAKVRRRWRECNELKQKIDALSKELNMEQEAQVKLGEAPLKTILESEHAMSIGDDHTDNAGVKWESWPNNESVAVHRLPHQRPMEVASCSRLDTFPLSEHGNEARQRRRSSDYMQGQGTSDQSTGVARVEHDATLSFFDQPISATLIQEIVPLDTQSLEVDNSSLQSQRRNSKWHFWRK